MPKRRTQVRSHRTTFLTLAVVLLVCLAFALPSLAESSRQGVMLRISQRRAADELAEIWDNVQDAGSYKLAADAEQTLLPVGLPQQIGEGETHVLVHMEGQTQLPDRAMLSMRLLADGIQTQSMRVYRQGDQMFLQDGAEIEPIDDPAATGLASADYLSYLAGATNVHRQGDEQGLARYTFDIDGNKLAQHQIDAIRRELAEQGALPEGAQLDPDGPLTRATGTGELWANEDGLPARQVIMLDIPSLTEGYDASTRLTIDFSDYGCDDALPSVTEDTDGVWRLQPGEPPASSGAGDTMGGSQASGSNGHNWLGAILTPITRVSPFSLALVALLALAIHLYRSATTQRQRLTVANRVNAVFAVGMVFVLVASPLLQTGQWLRFAELTAQAAAPPTTRAKKEPDELIAPEPPPTADELAVQVADAEHSVALQAGDDNDDSDGDGLTNAYERALGTDPLREDTDRDGLTDGLEVNGFSLGGRDWTSNPIALDSNGDGLSDFDEWEDPDGLAKDHDVDNDGVPNIWDEDNDDDGLPDSIDLSPLGVGDYRDDIGIVTQAGDSYDGHFYVEFQVQPENADHLRYSTATLDWPHDEEGQMSDLDGSTEDLRLKPFLRIVSNCAPSADMGRNYGVRSWQEDDGSNIILAPLTPVNDGGQIRAFYAKVPLAPSVDGHVPDLNWTAEMVWLVLAEVDYQTKYPDTIATRTTTLHTYYETFRLTGLKFTKTSGFDTFLLGTPGSQYEDRDLIQAYMGMNALFLEYDRLRYQAPSGESALDHLNYRFENTFPVTYTLGVDASSCVTAYEQYAHEDEALGEAASSLIPDFLNAHYSTAKVCPTREDGDVAHATLLVASETTYGTADLSRWSGDGSFFDISLLDIPLVRTRSVKLVPYTIDPDSGGWERAEPSRLMDVTEERYRTNYEGMVDALASRYSHLTVDALRYVTHLVYMSAWAGSQVIVASDDTLYIEQGPIDDAEICEQYGRSAEGDTFDDLPTFATWVSGLGEELDDAIAANEREWGADNPMTESALASSAVTWIEANPDLADMVGSRPTTTTEVSRAVAMLKKYDMSIKQVRLIIAGGKMLMLAANLFSSYKLYNSAKTAHGFMATLKSANAASKFPKLALVGMIFSIAVTWTIFGVCYGAIKNDPAALNMAIAVSIVNTIWYIFLFALNFIPIIGNIISAILSLIDGILSWATNGNWSMAHVIVRLFYDAKNLTKPGDADFVDFGSGVRDERLGLVQGNYLQIEAWFEGTMLQTSDGEDDDLRDSWIRGHLYKHSGEMEATTASNIGTYEIRSRVRHDNNNPVIWFGPLIAQTNASMSVYPAIEYKYAWAEYGLYGAFRYSTKDKTVTIPSTTDDRDVFDIVVDVLPADLDGLWTWNIGGDDHTWNDDRDADEISNLDEAGYGTDPDNWDSDGDGISDKYELDQADELGLDVHSSDTDGDGLGDGYELRLGTNPAVADTDDDGLIDAEEIYHHDASNGWMGSWLANMPGGATERVYSSAVRADADRDEMDDSDERANQLSPYAANDAPRLRILGDPRVISPDGQWGTWVVPNQEIELDIEVLNTGSMPVTTTLAVCFPYTVQLVEGGNMHAEDPPLTNVGACGDRGLQYAWDFYEHELDAQQVATTTFTLRGRETDATISDTIPLNLTFRDQDIQREMLITVDADWPEITIATPAEDACLSGDRHVMGGTASDEGSWVTGVEVSINAEGAPDGAWQEAEGIGLWAFGWDLPEDGRYQMRVRAADQVDHETTTLSRAFIVDNTPPTMSLTLPGGNYVRPEDEVVLITGQADDNLAGVRRVQLSLNGQPWRSVTLDDPGATSTTWQYAWPVGDDAQGVHSLLLRAVDAAGNASDMIEDELIVDQMAPTDELTDRTYTNAPPAVPVGQEHVLVGVANESGRLPEVARPPELTERMDVYDDSTIWLGLSNIGDNDGGVTAAWLGDVDNDRLADLAIGLPADDRVAIVYGQSGDWALPPDLNMLDDVDTAYVGAPGSGFGALIAPAGDVDGDALLDILVGASNSAEAYVIRGRTGPQGERTVDEANLPSWSLVSAPAAITGLAAAGDINDDGVDDLLVVADGRAYLELGQLFPWPDSVSIADDAAAIVQDAVSATGVGDMDGDNLADYVVARDGAILLFTSGDNLEAGDLHEPMAAASFATADSAPYVAALGDIDGDGLADLAYSDGTTPRVVLGRVNGGWDVSCTLSGYNPAITGYLAAPGDVDGDGLSDVILSNDDDELYLILGQDDWSTPPAIRTTFEDTTGIAQTPYAVAADINADGSSDLLLIPEPESAEGRGYDARSLTGMGWVDASNLPQGQPSVSNIRQSDGAVLAAIGLKANANELYVDDDYCATCVNDGYTWGQNAYDSIPDAMAAADGSGKIIHVQPGVYPAFTVGSSLTDLTIRGAHPDGVFIDGDGGAFACKLDGVRGVTIADMTLRNADRGVWLDGAGALGHETSAYRCELEGLLVHGCDQAVYSDRTSAIEMRNCTLATDGQASHPLIEVDQSEPDPDLYKWTEQPEVGADMGHGGALAAGTDSLFALPGGNLKSFYEYNLVNDSWSTRASVPVPVGRDACAAVSGSDTLWALIPDPFGGFAEPLRDVMAQGANDITVASDDGVHDYDGEGWERKSGSEATFVTEIDSVVYRSGSDGAIVRCQGDQCETIGWLQQGDIWDGYLHAVAVDGDDVYFGGEFEEIEYWNDDVGALERIYTDNIARWDVNDGWHVMGHANNSGLIGPTGGDCYGIDYVNALLIKSGVLYAGGFFYRGFNTDSWDDADEIYSHNVIGYNLTTSKWLKIAGPDGGSGGIITYQGDWQNGDCDSLVYVHDMVDWDSDSILIVGEFPHYGDPGNGPGGDAWNMAFYNTNNTWTAPPTWARTNGPIYDVEWQGTDLYVTGDFTTVTSSEMAANRIARLDSTTQVWTALGAGLNGPGYGLDYLTDNHTLYVVGDFTTAGDNGHYNIAKWDEAGDTWPGGQFFYRYDGSWHKEDAPPTLAGEGAAMAYNSDGYLYALMGGGTDKTHRFNTAAKTWHALGDLEVSSGSALCSVDGTPYAVTGEHDNRIYSYTDGSWRLVNWDMPETGYGADLVWDGVDALYLFPGGGSSDWWRLYISNETWEQMDAPTVSAFAAYGHGVERVGQSLYAYLSPMGQDGGFYECARVGVPNTKLSLDGNAFVAPSSASSPVWMDPSVASPDYGIVEATGSTWVADAEWTPAVPRKDTLTHSRAKLYNLSEDLFRPGRGSLLENGYAAYLSEARVSPTYCAVCDNDGLTWGVDAFHNIQDAIESGANHVLISPGVYQEPFHLLSGVQVSGHGADHTLIEAPVGWDSPIVQAEGVSGAGISRMSLVGNGASTGLLAKDNAELVAKRLIIRENAAGISGTGADTDIEIANNTIVNNTDGIVLTADAPVDVRNTILAHNSGRGLAFETDAERESHLCNDYWANGVDMDHDDSGVTPDPGAGELFLDPLFTAALSHDYRPDEGSPCIDAGVVNDPAPPGTGERIDIGYAEDGRAAYYVDDDYTPTGENHGLTWASDAFAEIQPAMDAAAVTVRSLGDAVSADGYTVNVAEGTYQEAPSLPSYVHVVGSGADVTTIELAQEDGASVRMDGIVESSLSYVEITGSKGASSPSLVEEITTTFMAVELDSVGSLVAGYMDEDITMAEYDGDAWWMSVAEMITPTEITDMEMLLDSNDYPHIMYAWNPDYQSNKSIVWLRWDGDEWIKTLPIDGNAGDYLGFDLDPNDNPFLGYTSDSGHRVYTVRWDGSAWIDSREAGHYDGYSSENLTVGTYEYYYFDDLQKYRYAGFGSDGQVRRYQYWEEDIHSTKETLLDAVDLAHDINLVIEPSPDLYSGDDYPAEHYVYGDATNGRLRYWTCYRGNSSKQTIDSGTNIGYYNDIAAGPDHMPHVAYTKDGELWYAFKTKEPSQSYYQGTWASAQIDDGSRGEIIDVALDVDSSNQGHVLYCVDTPQGPRLEYLTVWYAGEQLGVHVSGGSRDVSVERTLIHNVDQGVVFDSRASGDMSHNTIAAIEDEGVLATDAYTLLRTDSNVITDAAVGLRVTDSAQLLCAYDLAHADTNVDGATEGDGMVYADPGLDASYRISVSSPALDAANPYNDVPAGGGVRADIGHHELIAAPLPLMFGQEVRSTAVGNSGVDATEIGITLVADPSQPVTETLPSSWAPAVHADEGESVSQWSYAVTPDQEALYRVYSRARDVVGNDEADDDEDIWYTGAYIGDATPSTIDWVSPTGSTSTDGAAIHLIAQAADYVDVGDGPRFAVDEIAFLVDGEHVPSTWVDDPDWDASAQQPRQFEAHVSLAAGQHSVTALAVDEAGHQATTNALTINATNSDHCATITSHTDGQVVRETELALRGYVRFSAPGSGSVAAQASGQAAVDAVLDNPIGQRTAWGAAVTLADADGPHTITVTPTLGTAGSVSTLNLLLDRGLATLDVTSPSDGSTVVDTVSIEGTATDALSAVDEVAYSLDGGYVWTEIARQGDAFSVEVDLPDGEDSVSYPIRIRATDSAGNETIVARVVSLDSQPPTGLSPTTFNIDPGTHVQIHTTLIMSWTEPFDAGGVAGTTVEFNMGEETVPIDAASGSSHQAALTEVGLWYAHLAAEDAIGNQRVLHFGPWYVEDTLVNTGSGSTSVGLKADSLEDSRQSIIIDGLLDVDNDEWLPEEWLDDANWYDRVQDLHVAWDGLALFLGYGGAWWGMDGELWLYVDVAPGGTITQPAGSETLPFLADWAVQVSDGATALLWGWDGSSWNSQTWDDWAMGASTGQTEVRLPWSTINGGSPATSLSIMTVTDQPTGDTGVVMPTTNPTEGPWNDAFRWDNIAEASSPGAGQPRAVDVTLEVVSDTPSDALLGPDEAVRYRLTVANNETRAVPGVRIALDASAGLGYYAPLDPADGATCASCPEGGASWTLDMPELTASSEHVVTVTARTAADLTGIEQVTSSANMSATPDPVMNEPVVVDTTHQVDGKGAIAEIDAEENAPVPVGAWDSSGTANDSDGIGVQAVEVRLAGQSWQSAAGTMVWQSTLDIPNTDQVTIEARAQDGYGQYGAIKTRNLLVDRTPPQVDWTAPTVSTGDVQSLTGSANDPAPTTGRIAEMALQFDDPNNSWRTLTAVTEQPDGSSAWRYDWSLPYEDGQPHTVRARATDLVGLVTTDTWQTTMVDAVSPIITTTKALADVTVDGYGVPHVVELMAGDITDGMGVDRVDVQIIAPDGSESMASVALQSNAWSYAPDISAWLTGDYVLTIQGDDVNGNQRLAEAHTVTLHRVLPALEVAHKRLSVNGVPDATVAHPDDVVTYRTVVRNVGEGSAVGVEVTATLPYPDMRYEGTTSVEQNTLKATDPIVDGGAITWPLDARLEPNQTLTVTFQARVTNLLAPPSELTTSSGATGNTEGGEPIAAESGQPGDNDDDDADAASLSAQARDVTLTMTPARDEVCAGWNYPYDLVLANGGDQPLSDIDIRVEIPTSSEPAVAESWPEWVQSDSNAWVWTVANLAPSEIASSRLMVHLYRSLPHGDTITVTADAIGIQIITRTQQLTSTVCTDGPCAPDQPTPTTAPTPTASPTAEPPAPGVYLPLIVRGAGIGTHSLSGSPAPPADAPIERRTNTR